MTDEQIIKGLECCADDSVIRCEECPYGVNIFACNQMQMRKDALDLINRQQAEIEKLDKESTNIVKMLDEKCDECIEFNNRRAKAEAIKEFAERLHCHCESIINEPWNEKAYPNSWACAYKEFEDVIENLVKEMVGDTD